MSDNHAHPRAGAPGWLWLGLAALWLFAAQAGANDDKALSIERAMQLARADAPQLDADAARITAAREDARRAGELPDPTLMLGIDNLMVTGSNAWHLGADEMTMRRIGISQELPSRRKRDARTAQADARVAESEVARAAGTLAVERAAAAAWIQRWTAQTRLELLAELAAELDTAVALAEAQLRGGEGSSADALAARAARAEFANQLAVAEAEVTAARAGLARWVGPLAAAPLAAAPDFTQLRIPADRLRSALDQHAVLQLWDARERVAQSAVTLAQAGSRPDLRLGMGYGARSGLGDMVSVELGIGLPLFARNRQDRDTAARRAERDAVIADHDAARRGQREALEQTLARWQANAEEIARYRATLLPLARDRVRVSLAAFGGGANVEPWLDARRDEVQLRLRYVETLNALAVRWATLATLLPGEGVR